MIDSYLSVEQSKREQQGIEARDLEASRETDWYSGGFFDGLIHWSQVKEIRKKSSEKTNRVKLIKNKQLSDFISLWARVKD